MKHKLLRFSLLGLLLMLSGMVFADEVTMKYPGGTTTNMTGENDAATVGLDATAWSVVGDKGASSNYPGLNKAGDIRLYWSANGGNTITVESLTGATINSIAITFTGDEYSNVSVTVDGNAVEAVDGAYAINASSFVLGNANTSSAQVRISEVVINYTASGIVDNRQATTITLGDHPTTGEVNTEIQLPTATVMAGESTLDAAVTWSSSNEEVAALSVVDVYPPMLNLLTAGETTLTATYAGDDNYKGSSASFRLTVTPSGLTITSFQALQEACTSTSTPAAITFNGEQVVYVNGNNAYLADANGYGAMVYTKNHGLVAGQVLNGTINANIVLYQGAAEITDFSSEGLTITNADVVPQEKTVAEITKASQSTLVTLQGLHYSYNADTKTATLTDASGSSIVYYDKFRTNVAFNEEDTYHVTGIVLLYNDVIEIGPRTADDVVATEPIVEPAEFKNFAVIVNNQDGTLLTTDEQVQGTAVSFGVAVDADGNTIRVDVDDAKSIATVSGNYHSEHGMTNLKVVTAVPGPVKILVGQCTYSSKQIKVTDADGNVVVTATPATACWKNDRSNVTELIYEGEATTLTITGPDYCPFVAVKEYVAPAEFQDFAAIVNNQEGTLLTADEMATQYTAVLFGVAVDAEGNTVRVAADDAKSIATISGKYHSEHGMTNLKVVTAVPGPVKILVGQCTYSSKDIKVTDADGNVVVTATPATACWKNDRSNVTELVYEGEATTLTITGPDYCPFIAVQKVEIEPKPTFPITATWDFTNADVVAAAVALSGSTEPGTIKAVEDNGILLTVEANGQTIRDNSNSIQTGNGVVFKVPVQGKKDVVTVTGYSAPYFAYSVAGVDATEAVTSYTATAADVAQGYVEIVNKGQYLIAISVIQNEDDSPKDITGTWDYADATVMDATMAFSGSNEAGEVEAVEKNGLKMIVEANGATFRNNNGTNIQVRTGAVFKVPVRSAGDLITVKGYPSYSYYTIGNSTDVLNNEQTYTAKRSDAEAGYVAITSANDNNYYLSISVVQYAPKELITLNNEAATINFPFNLGTEGQTATINNADYFLTGKVSHGEGLFIKDKNNGSGFDMTRFEPYDQNNSADASNAILFPVQPKPGFAFTPTKVSLKTTRFGTDNGLLDIAWKNADGTTVTLATEVKPNRNSGTNPAIASEEGQKFSNLSYEVTGATPGEGVCGLVINLYHLQSGKQVGFADIIIEGVLNGTEKEVPILASFKANGVEYAAEDVFGDLFEATLELPKVEPMISAENPLTDVSALSGEIGQLTYQGTETSCVVTIPMTAGDTQIDYVLNVVQKPDFTLYYISPADGQTVLTTQKVEKDAPIGRFQGDAMSNYSIPDGYAMRGWFERSDGGCKYTVEDIVTSDLYLYGYCTEIETCSTYKKYNFDLTDPYFYAEDHEAFNPAGEGYYWHDAQHGWAFKNGNTIDLLVGPKATVTVTLCQYGSGTGIAVKKDGETLATIDGKSDGDGGTAVFNYEGDSGTLTLEMQCGGEMYIHAVKIVNTTEVNFESDGQWYFVKAGDAGSLIDVLDVVNGVNASRDAERAFIFLPDGVYDLRQTVKTAITGHNISIIGQSMEGTIITTRPDKSLEGLGKADLFDASGSNLYLQDLTLQNALDYYGALSGGQVGGRAAVLQDAGTRTIGKNVRMLSYQDTYYSSNASQQAYWEDCDIHGTVDFICGGGDIRFQHTTISLEPRALNGTGSRTITAPTTTTQFGYVFDGCTVVDLAKGKGEWNFGRTWQNNPICVYLNTTLDDNARNTLIATRWIEKGMNNRDPKLFGEYGTKDASGADITPASNVINSYGGPFQTILTQEQAEGFAYDKMFTTWDPAAAARQIDATAAYARYDGGTVSFYLDYDDMQGCAIFRNGQFAGLSFDGTFNIAIDPAADELTIRAINQMGGFGPAAHVDGTTTRVSDSLTDAPAQAVYNLQGVRVGRPSRGLYIVNGKKVVMK